MKKFVVFIPAIFFISLLYAQEGALLLPTKHIVTNERLLENNVSNIKEVAVLSSIKFTSPQFIGKQKLITHANEEDVKKDPNKSLIQTDSILWFSDREQAILHAQQSNTFLAVYYQPEDCKQCSSSLKKLFDLLKADKYSYDTKQFNNKFSLHISGATDTAILKNAGIKKFPGMAFYTADGKILLGYKYDQDLNTFITELVNPDMATPSMWERIYMQQLIVVRPIKIKESEYDTAIVKKYLEEIFNNKKVANRLRKEKIQKEKLEEQVESPQMERAATTNSLAISKTEETQQKFQKPSIDSTISSFNINIDTAFVLGALDSLVAKTPKPTAGLAQLIINIASLTDEGCCPYPNSKLLSNSDAQFAPKLSYQYLLNNYEQFKQLETIALGVNYSEVYFPNLYEFLSRRLNDFIQQNKQPNLFTIEQALMYQADFVTHFPSLEELEKPLLVNNIMRYTNTLPNGEALFTQFALPYIKSLNAAPSLPLFINTIVNKLVKNDKGEANYIVWNYSPIYYRNKPIGTSDNQYYSGYFNYQFGSLFNKAAKHLFQNSNATDTLKLAMQFINKALLLDKFNPYYNDTYAHLLLKQGKNQLAIQAQKQTVEFAKKSRSDYYDYTVEEIENFKTRLADMIKESKLTGN